MTHISFENMNIKHVYELANNIRDEDRMECLSLGSSPRTMIRKCYYESIMKKVTLIDGKVAGAWGVAGTLLGYIGKPWLITSKEVEKAPIPLALAYRQAVKEMHKMFPVLENYCDFSYKKSLKMLELCGFKVHEPILYGPKGALFCRFTHVR